MQNEKIKSPITNFRKISLNTQTNLKFVIELPQITTLQSLIQQRDIKRDDHALESKNIY